MSGQTLTDRIAAAQYQLTGSDMARAVCKATTHEVMAPKKKHLEYLVSATNTTNVNIPQMADTLFERATNASWVVVFKALVTTHHMCVHGNERFIQYLASRTSLFNLSNFIDKTGSHGYDMSTFIRRYGRYLNEKAFAYRQMAFDFTRVKKGAEGVMRTMTTEKLLKGMPVLQTQIDTLLEFDVHPKELNNGIINAAFMLLFKDLVKLFASYNDGIINLLEKYFKMKKSDCKEALEIYKRFLTRVTKIGEFMKLAEAPSSILESLETHMNGLEDVKGGKKGALRQTTCLQHRLQPNLPTPFPRCSLLLGRLPPLLPPLHLSQPKILCWTWIHCPPRVLQEEHQLLPRPGETPLRHLRLPLKRPQPPLKVGPPLRPPLLLTLELSPQEETPQLQPPLLLLLLLPPPVLSSCQEM
ncbi:hypothetical protein INR49_032021 [Xyrichtys novacula]|uniref:ENTH domain-containing protein n=1 Tax=Xyrichtys novacula TaxID=13765 RepID=A0AAV1GUE2_XYRNO|nr:hypothetical protein INR49_032021 [Xyrichtys novacula]